MKGSDFYALLVIYVIEIFCGTIYSFYRMVNFAHSGDTVFAKSRCARITIWLGMFMWVLPIIWVPLDVLLSSHSELSRLINDWCLILSNSCQLIYIWFLAPILLAFYETEQKDSTCKRIG